MKTELTKERFNALIKRVNDRKVLKAAQTLIANSRAAKIDMPITFTFESGLSNEGSKTSLQQENG